jgi:nitrate reductase NapA
MHRDFTGRHVVFARGRSDIGFGIDEQTAVAEVPVPATRDEFAAFLRDYTPESAQRISGLGADEIRWLASLYGNRALKVVTV